jgi:hypothetical protein
MKSVTVKMKDMNKNHQTYKTSSRELFYQLTETDHAMGIGRVNFVWDQQRSQLILLLESDQMFNREASPLIRDNRLILNAPFLSYLERPIHTHLIDRDIREEVELGVPDNGFTEIKLKTGYAYSVVSCTLTDPYMLKVILRYRPLDKNYN